MNFYEFRVEDGFDYRALIFSATQMEAINVYNDYGYCDNNEPRLINNSQALELICSCNLNENDFDEIISEIKKAQNSKESVLVLIDSALV